MLMRQLFWLDAIFCGGCPISPKNRTFRLTMLTCLSDSIKESDIHADYTAPLVR